MRRRSPDRWRYGLDPRDPEYLEPPTEAEPDDEPPGEPHYDDPGPQHYQPPREP